MLIGTSAHKTERLPGTRVDSAKFLTTAEETFQVSQPGSTVRSPERSVGQTDRDNNPRWRFRRQNKPQQRISSSSTICSLKGLERLKSYRQFLMGWTSPPPSKGNQNDVVEFSYAQEKSERGAVSMGPVRNSGWSTTFIGPRWR